MVSSERYTESFGERVYYFDYGVNSDIEMLGMFLEKGTFPREDNEILIDENYMTLKGYDYNVIGNKIKVEVSEGVDKTFKVSGVVKTQSAFDDYEVSEFRFYIYKQNYKKIHCMHLFMIIANWIMIIAGLKKLLEEKYILT